MSPRFSVVVPVYRDWEAVPGLLAALAAQTLAAFEILLVDNGSGSGAEAPPLALPPEARLVACATPGSYAARNAGAAVAAGDWLVFTDADCITASAGSVWPVALRITTILVGDELERG